MSGSKAEVLQRLQELKRQRKVSHSSAGEAERRYREILTPYSREIRAIQREADRLAGQFRSRYDEASEAYENGEGGLAKEYSDEGQQLQEECEALNAKANAMREELRQLRDLIDREERALKSCDAEIGQLTHKLQSYRQTAVANFAQTELLDDLRVERLLDSFPQKIFAHVSRVEYLPNLVQRTPGGLLIPARGRTQWTHGNAVIAIGRQNVGRLEDSIIRYGEALAHELGHVAHEFDLSDHEKAEWYSLHAETATPVSPEAIPDEIEDFAECFRLACLDPHRLSNIDARKLEFLRAIQRRLS